MTPGMTPGITPGITTGITLGITPGITPGTTPPRQHVTDKISPCLQNIHSISTAGRVKPWELNTSTNYVGWPLTSQYENSLRQWETKTGGQLG